MSFKLRVNLQRQTKFYVQTKIPGRLGVVLAVTSFVEGSAIFFRLVSFVVFAFDTFCGLIFEEAGLLFEDLLRRRVFGSSSALNKNHGKRELLETRKTEENQKIN